MKSELIVLAGGRFGTAAGLYGFESGEEACPTPQT